MARRYVCSGCGETCKQEPDSSGRSRGPVPTHCPPCKREHLRNLPSQMHQPMIGPRGAVCVCRYCGQDFVAATRVATSCESDECRKARHRERGAVWRAQRLATNDPCTVDQCRKPAFTKGLCRRHYKRVLKGNAPGALVDRFACATCGKDVVPGADGVAPHATRFCSSVCKRQMMADLRRVGADAFVEPVSRPAIFERDRWICQLCGDPVRRDVAWPHPMFPTLDHVIPLSRGGTHEPANTQTAHARCNGAKGNRGGGEQLALVG